MADLTPRVLVVAPYAPSASADHGSAVALRGALRALARRTPVVLVHPDGPVDPALESACLAVETFPITDDGFVPRRDLPALLRGRMLRSSGVDLDRLTAIVHRLALEHEIDVVRADGIEVADVLGGLPERARRVVVVYEPARSVEVERRADASIGHRLVARLDTRARLRQEARAMRTSDLVVSFTEADAAVLAAHDVPPPVAVIPLGWDVAPPRSARRPDHRGTTNTIVFVGNFVHRPNVDAAIRLVSSILPLVTAQVPDARLRLVGANPPDEVRALEAADVVVTGRVDDVGAHLDDASVVVAPLHTGGGSRVKVLEALAAGTAVVATPLALEGVAPPPDVAIAAGDDASFAAAVVDLLRDPERQAALGAAARHWASTELSWDRVTDRHLAHYAELLRR